MWCSIHLHCLHPGRMRGGVGWGGWVDRIRSPLPFALSRSWKDGGGPGWGGWVDRIRSPLPFPLSRSWKDGGGVGWVGG